MIIVDCEQNSEEWHKARLCVPTASSFSKILTSTGKASTQRTDYVNQLVAEHFTGVHEESYSGKWTEHGHDTEDEAIESFEFAKDIKVQKVGFVLHDSGLFGCSPDALVGEYSGLEIKCPKSSTQVKYLLAGKLPSTYFPQVQGSMLVTDRNEWNFMTYCPGIKPLIITIQRDYNYTDPLHDKLIEVAEEVKSKIKQIKGEQ